MTATVPNLQHRTGPELIYTIADHVRAGRDIDDAVVRTLKGEQRSRYVNTVADLCAALHLTEPVNCFDADLLPDPQSDDALRREDHPAAYGMRLDIWAATVHSRAAIAAALDDVANRMADSLPDFMILGAA
jgi:hypothetical protein